MSDDQRQMELAETALAMHAGSRREAKLWVSTHVGDEPAFIAGAERWIDRLADGVERPSRSRFVLLMLILVVIMPASWNCASGATGRLYRPVEPKVELTSVPGGARSHLRAMRVRVTVRPGDESAASVLGDGAWEVEVATRDEVVLTGCAVHPTPRRGILRLEIVRSCPGVF